MRLLTVSHFYEAHGGGIERVAGALNRELRAQGHATSWAAANESALPTGETATAIPLSCINPIEAATGLPMPIPTPRALVALARAVREADAVIVHDALYLTSIVATLLARHYRRPVVLIQHIAGVPFSSRILRGVMALANRVIARPIIAAAHEVIFISDTVRQAFADVRRSTRAHLIFNGVDSEVFHTGTPGARAATRADLGIGAEPMLLFVGRFVEKKGLHILARVAAATPATRFVFAGTGPIDPAAWGLANVTVVHGRSRTELAALYVAADALVLPSVGEGYPLVVQEALACGLPVICGAETARADPAASQWLSGVEIDLSDPAGSTTRVLRAIRALHVDSQERAAMRHHARKNYNWSAMATAIAGLCQRAVHNRQLAATAASRSAAV